MSTFGEWRTRSGGIAHSLARGVTGLLVLVVAAVLVLALVGLFLPGELRWPEADSASAEIAEVLPPDIPTDTVERVRSNRSSPAVVKVTLQIDQATSLHLVYPSLLFEGRGVPSPLLDASTTLGYTTDGPLDIERLVPLSILPDDCGESCTMSLWLVDPRDVHVLTDGSLAVTTTPMRRVPTEMVIEIALDDPIARRADVEVDVCVDGFEVTDERDGLGRYVVLQRRRPDQVGPAQLSLRQAAAESLHERASDECQVRFSVGALTWGSPNDDGLYDEIVLNVVHWGQTSLDDTSAIVASVEL